MKRIDLEDHIFKDCKKAKPGIRIDRHVDPRPYHEMKTQNIKKLRRKTKSVIVEDDFVTAKDFRDPGGRKLEA